MPIFVGIVGYTHNSYKMKHYPFPASMPIFVGIVGDTHNPHKMKHYPFPARSTMRWAALITGASTILPSKAKAPSPAA